MVLGLRTSWAAASELEAPSATSRAWRPECALTRQL